MDHLKPGAFALRAMLTLVIIFPFFVSPVSQPVKAANPSVMISQVFGSGGNSGAKYNTDYVELYNAGTEAANLTGWSLQYASAIGSSWTVSPLSGILDPGHFFLVAEDAGNTGDGQPIPFVDVSPSKKFNLSATTGKVALVNTTNALNVECPKDELGHLDESIVDFLGYGANATCYEGSGPAPTLPNPVVNYAWFRVGTLPADSNDNKLDFTYAAPEPRDNYLGFDRPPYVELISPENGAFQVQIDGNITITLSETVDPAVGWFLINCQKTGVHTAEVNLSPTVLNTYVLNPQIDFDAEETCALTILATHVTDLDATPGTPMKADYHTIFATGDPKIHRIQGAQHRSLFEGARVEGLTGVVTAVYSSGFFMQDPNPDSDLNTSEGIYVFTDQDPAIPAAVVGDQVQVDGTVAEYRPEVGSLTLTEITDPLVLVGPSGSPLPAPQVIGAGGRLIPTAVIEDDAETGDVETGNIFDPDNDALDFFESLEGMRVQVSDLVAVGPTTSGGEVTVLADNGQGAEVRTERSGLLYQYADPNPERLMLGNRLIGSKMPKVNVGARFPGTLTGILDYRSSSYTLEIEAAPVVIPSGLAAEVAPAAGPNQLAVASFNLENLAATDSTTKFNNIAAQIVTNLKSPDILAVEEVQDNNGSTNDDTVAANLTYEKLIGTIQAKGGPLYQYAQIDPQKNLDGGAAGSNIRVALLYRTDRGLSFVPGTAGDATSANSVVTDAQGRPHLAFNPGRILDLSSGSTSPNNAFFDSRKPLAGEFSYNGNSLFVIVNHFNSKGGDTPLFGQFQPPVRSSEVQRLKQAQVVHDFVNGLLEMDSQAGVIVLGDLNDFQFSPVLERLKGSPPILHDLIADLPLAEQYTYVYEGNAQVLDHVLVSDELYARQISFKSVHVNAEFYNQVSDHDPQLLILGDLQRLYLPAVIRH